MKYRVWDKKEKQFIENVFIIPDGRLLMFTNYDTFNSEWDFVDDEDRYIISECSQHKDNAGKPIYEGDIVIFNNDYSELYEVIFENSQWYVTSENIMSPLCECNNNELSVIENIYENPELLEVE